MVWSYPPADNKYRSYSVNLTFITCSLCPRKLLAGCFSITGFLYRLTRPKSSPLAYIEWSLDKSTVFIWDPSHPGGYIPYTLQPNLHVLVAHSVSLVLVAPPGSYFF